MLEILYQDEDLCVINKPSGYVTHKTRGAGDSPVVLQTLRDQLETYVYPLHRLDRGTSGCMLFALKSEVVHKLQQQLQSDASVKKYTALCFGHLDPEGFYDRSLTSENKEKQHAYTKYRVLEEINDFSLLDLEIFTGRKNQIRRHLSHEKHHIIGDVRYGKGWLNKRFREDYDFHRLFLHCNFLSFINPISGEKLNIWCDSPDELTELLEKLKR
jgi:tRNA pseudouridine65 synthase